jgi:sphingosine kinase
MAHIDITLRTTERKGHAYDIIKDEVQPGQYNGIVTVSGDGLIHESVNGALNRPDGMEFLNTVHFGFIPAGSGNGLHKSVTSTFNEVHGVHSAAFSVAKGRNTKMDLTEL